MKILKKAWGLLPDSLKGLLLMIVALLPLYLSGQQYEVPGPLRSIHHSEEFRQVNWFKICSGPHVYDERLQLILNRDWYLYATSDEPQDLRPSNVEKLCDTIARKQP